MATAYAALVSLLNDLDLIQNHPRHSFSFDNNQIQSLLGRVCFLIDFMETCDYQGAAEAEALENKIAVATHAAQDVILSRVADQIRSGSTLKKKTRLPRFLLDQIHRGSLDLQETIEDMEFVRRKAIKVHKRGFKVDQPTFSSTAAAATPSTHQTSQKNAMVGFDEVLYQLLDLLTGEAGERVIPIIAMGGAGKTTLARNAFQHKLVQEHFDVCLWATISQSYEVEGILNQLLGSKSSGQSVAELKNELHKSLFGRRYLIVLDDMWSFEPWHEIRFYFPEDKRNKSRIIVTSRQSHLADHLSSPRFPLDLLDEEKSWDLFCENVFGDKEGCPPELELVGHKIVKKCSGLPLAIVVAGGHLRNSLRTQKYWMNVAYHMDNILSSDVNEPCLDLLSLSYRCLPVHLKPCFLSMGILEEDQSIDASSLIKLWIGKGFIKSSKTQSLEEIAQGYLKDLVDRNLILAYKRCWNGKIKRCKLHDIVRELCLKIAGNEKFLCGFDKLEAVPWECRVVVPKRRWVHVGQHQIRHLRVLNDVDGDILKVGCHQVNLRYLGCFKYMDFDISPSLSLLWSLQTLIVKGFSPSIMVPYEFWEILLLRHFESNGTICLPNPLPNNSGRSVQGNLQTLLGVRNLRLSEEVCKRISHIKELRIIYNDLESLCDEMRSLFCPQNLSLLHKLELLEIEVPMAMKMVFQLGSHDEKQEEVLKAVSSLEGIESVSMDTSAKKLTVVGDVDTVEIVEKLKKICHSELVVDEPAKEFSRWHGFVSSFRFPDSLNNLSLHQSCLFWEELSMMAGSLPLLETLRLDDNAVIGSEWNTVEGHFNHLKSLTIYDCRDLVNFNVDSSHFPVLVELVLEFLPMLDKLPSSIGELPSLQLITLRSCSVPLAVSAMRILVEQEQDYGNESLRLEVSFPCKSEKKRSFKEKMQEEGLDSNNLFLS